MLQMLSEAAETSGCLCPRQLSSGFDSRQSKGKMTVPNKCGKGIRYSNVLLGFVSLLILFCTQASGAQALPLHQAKEPQLSSYCKTASPAGAKLMRGISKIIAHGDLTDVASVEKSLGIEFSWKSHLDPDKYPTYYKGGLPGLYNVTLIVMSTRMERFKREAIAQLFFDFAVDYDNTPSCERDLYISESDFSSHFNGGFHLVSSSCSGHCAPKDFAFDDPKIPIIVLKTKDIRQVCQGRPGIRLNFLYTKKLDEVFRVSLIEIP